MATQIPDDKNLTIRWLFEHIPIRWWATIVAILVGTFSTGYAVRSSFTPDAGVVSANDLIRLEDKKSELREDILQLQKEKSSLQAEIAALTVERRISGMTNEEIRRELKEKWTRD